ncbi:hypothetical protein, conserved [Trypanosoma brucei brucei TREU927]|uniref:Uncharacterized protein n=1 Tax=Trypanosoma brucei brucei (strain 927/4 GUTat10.1) TaxID=185431 RepID=Q384D6_TRYB2|nr:hypothetical protein, conserved [Trypanosoma brucei brucei TREU927]EAN79845.1 hypothetical protein, conserved [Trypanosoma brucei brucei TREU927]
MDEDMCVAAAAFRGTEEYAAVFDLEVWKAQQQARLRSEINEEKARLQKAVAEEVRKKEAQRISELDALQQELQQLARRLQVREEALHRRISQFEVREAAFEDRRVKVAEQHEQHLLSLETRTRRQREEAATQVDVLKAQLAERDRSVALLEERLSAAESEYDKLQRYVSRVSTSDEDTTRTDALEEQLCAANSAMAKLQLRLKERDSELALASRERDQLKRTCEVYKDQLYQLTKRYNHLQEQCCRRERMRLDEERRRIDDSKRRYGIVEPRMGMETRSPRCYDLLGTLVAGGTSTRRPGDALAHDDCTLLLHELKSDVEKGMQKFGRRGKGVTQTKRRQDLVFAEVVVRQDEEEPLHVEGGSDRVCPVAHGGPAVPDTELDTGYADDFANTTISSLSHREGENHGVAVSTFPGMPIEEGLGQTDVGDISSTYCYADIESWGSGDEETRCRPIERKLRGDAAADLPPLAPAPAISDSFTDRSAAQHVSPPREPMEGPGATSMVSTRDSTRGEMIAFVEKLQENRRKLLDSGVYREDDSIVKEMSDKIALYENFLSQNF